MYNVNVSDLDFCAHRDYISVTVTLFVMYIVTVGMRILQKESILWLNCFY